LLLFCCCCCCCFGNIEAVAVAILSNNNIL
jgi:hypothetical protein